MGTAIMPVRPALARKAFEEFAAEQLLVVEAFGPFKIGLCRSGISHVRTYNLAI